MKTNKIVERMSPSDKERFWSKVDIKSEEECWEWKESLNPDGYGHISFGGRDTQRKFGAHRVAKALSMGEEIPPGMLVMHMCDNPPCCNPGHLVIGTHQENMDDMVRKGRAARNVNIGNVKLNWTIVDEIRSSTLNGNELANKHNVTKSTISYIRNGKTWREEDRGKINLPN